jgi:hypothetical protein
MGEGRSKNRMVKFFIISDYTVNAGKKGREGGGRGEGSPPAVPRDGLKKWSRGPTRHKDDNINREGSP